MNNCHGLSYAVYSSAVPYPYRNAVQADTTLSKANRASAFDAGKNLRAEIISHGMESSIRMERKGVTQV